MTLLCAGYFVGHPACGPEIERAATLADLLSGLRAEGRYLGSGVFADLAGATLAIERLGATVAAQGLWLGPRAAQRVRREDPGSATSEMLARSRSEAEGRVVAAGHDVIGLGGDLRLCFTHEDAGRELCRELGLPAEPPPFLPRPTAARRLAAALNDEELGAPVLWIDCWRTIHES